MFDLYVVEDLLKVVDWTRRHALSFELREQIIALHLRGKRRQFGDQFAAVLETADVILVSRVLRELGAADDVAELDVLVVIAGRDDDVAVCNRKYLVGHDVGVGVADALRNVARDEIVHRLVRQYAHGRVDQSGVDKTAFARLLAFGQRRQNPDDGIDAGEDVGNGNADAGRFAVGHAGQIHDAAHALRHQVVAGAFGVGAILAEPGDRAVDQARTFWRETFVIEAEPGEPADLEVLDQHVRSRGKLAHDAPALVALEVHLD
jgi:hypothetical protein